MIVESRGVAAQQAYETYPNFVAFDQNGQALATSIDTYGNKQQRYGQPLTTQNLEVITDRQDQIIAGLGGYATVRQKIDAETNYSNVRAAIGDIVSVGDKGQMHGPDGRFLSRTVKDKISANQKLLRKEYDTTNSKLALESLLKISTTGATPPRQMMTREEALADALSRMPKKRFQKVRDSYNHIDRRFRKWYIQKYWNVTPKYEPAKVPIHQRVTDLTESALYGTLNALDGVVVQARYRRARNKRKRAELSNHATEHIGGLRSRLGVAAIRGLHAVSMRQQSNTRSEKDPASQTNDRIERKSGRYSQPVAWLGAISLGLLAFAAKDAAPFLGAGYGIGSGTALQPSPHGVSHVWNLLNPSGHRIAAPKLA